MEDNLESAFADPQQAKQQYQQQYGNGDQTPKSYSNENYSGNNQNGSYNKSNNWKSNNNNWKNKGNMTKKASFDKENVAAVKLDTTKIHYSLNYRSYAVVIATNVEILDQSVLQRLQTLIATLEAKGYLFRGNDAKEGMQDHEKKNKGILNNMVKEVDKIYSGFAYGNDASKEKHFGVVKGLHGKYSELKDVIRSFLAKDVGLVVGENLNRPISLCIIVGQNGVNMKEETDYRRVGNLGFLLNVLKTTSRPFFNITNDDEYNECLAFVEKLP